MTLFAHRQTGDRAFERLYRAHVQDVYRYALVVLRNRADAEDVAQTTFLKAYRAMEKGDRPRHPRKWLITIAQHVPHPHARREAPAAGSLARDVTSTRPRFGRTTTPTSASSSTRSGRLPISARRS